MEKITKSLNMTAWQVTHVA